MGKCISPCSLTGSDAPNGGIGIDVIGIPRLIYSHNETCLGINFTSPLRADELADRARKALDRLRFVCPIITCDIEDDVSPRWVYTPSTDREAWLNRALVIQHQGKSLNSSEFILGTCAKKLPYVDGNGAVTRFRVYLLTTEGKEYGLYLHGCPSGFRALNLMLEWMSGEGMDVKIESSEEWKNLPVDPITATGGPHPAWESTGAELMQEFAVRRGRKTPLDTLTPSSHPSDISVPQFLHATTVSESDTAAIIAKTNELGISVTMLFYIAHFMAYLKMNPRPETDEIHFRDAVFVELDQYFKPSIDPRTHVVSALGLIPTGFSMAGPLSEQTDKARLIAAAKLLQAKFDKYLAHPCAPHAFSVEASMMPAEMKSEDDHIVTDSDGKSVRFAPWRGGIHDLGDMEKKIRGEYGLGNIITVEDIGVGMRAPTRMNVYLWTMHSKFHIHIQGATVWGEERMKTLVKDMLLMVMLIL